MNNTAKVFLVGAGPGDPDLLTIKAVKAIAAADVVLLDDLVNREVLQHARPGVRVIEVGKRGGCQSTPQEFIERMMVAEARAGHCVVRLKGGDPFIFGRGGEECATLRAEGIEVEVVNGISSGLAAPSSIGVPLTHRQYSQGAVFITGHGKSAEHNPDWATLAKLELTLVIYMGIVRRDPGGIAGWRQACRYAGSGGALRHRRHAGAADHHVGRAAGGACRVRPG